MAERRMFTKKITDDDNFLSLSASAQALYLHLTMSADDDGFCNQVTASMFKAHASAQDLTALLDKRYLIQFDNGVVCIKHWRMANTLRKDRYTPTSFQDDLSKLGIKENGSYTILTSGCQMVANWLPNGCHSIDKNRLDKDSIGKDIVVMGSAEPPQQPQRQLREQNSFSKPSVEDVRAYCQERKNSVDPQRFFDYYEANGWRVGKSAMKDWRAAVRTWERNERGGGKKAARASGDYGHATEEDYNFPDISELKKMRGKM